MITFDVITVHLQANGVKVYSDFVPYPSKTDRKTILLAAVEDLAHGGIRDLSLRNLAATLDLAPNAIYRYFSDRSALEAALADESARQLELALRKAADGCDPNIAIHRMATAYIEFSRENRHLYEVMMSFHAPEHSRACRQSLWMFTTEQVRRIAGEDRAEQASVALWALLHGVAVLEAAQGLSENKAAGGFAFGLHAWLLAVSVPISQTSASRSVRAKKS